MWHTFSHVTLQEETSDKTNYIPWAGGAESKSEDQFQCFFPTCQTSLMNVLGVVDSSRQAARGVMRREQL